MQYWIFYQAGVGGDGFGCMLEHATNIMPADGNLEWRIHYYEGAYGILQRPVRFYQALWANNPLPFRFPSLPDVTTLNPVYVNLIEQKQNTVITAHYNYFRLIDQFTYRELVEKNQIKIHLYSCDSARVYKDLVIKRGNTVSLKQFSQFHQYNNQLELARPNYHIHIDIEQVWRDWGYLKSCMDQIGIDLPKSVYDYYLTYIDNL
jgi:hypothetical protein